MPNFYKIFLVIPIVVLSIFIFVENANAVVPLGCSDNDQDGCVGPSDCQDPGNDPASGGTCSVCPAGNCGQTPPGGGSGTGTSTDGENWLGIDLSIQDVGNIITGIACWLLRVVSVIMVIFLILAGFRFMAAQSDPARFTAAKKNFFHVFIGIVVILGVYVIIATIANAIGADYSFIPLVCGD